jgi:hypothetical protein
MSKSSDILKHLQSGKPLNRYSAFRLFGHENLPTEISRFKRGGIEIKDRLVREKNAMGVMILCNEYFIP